MHVVHVFIEVLPEHVHAFREATIANALASRKEAGVRRFDFFQEEANATKFLLTEIYADAQAPALHRETAHYQTWRETVAPMMAQPRSSIHYLAIALGDHAV